jgi:predicted DNA-binding transcriptional regulator AlpA
VQIVKLINVAEIADLADVSTQAVYKWKERYESFPKAVGRRLVVGNVTVVFSADTPDQWREEEVKAWLKRRAERNAPL